VEPSELIRLHLDNKDSSDDDAYAAFKDIKDINIRDIIAVAPGCP
jgi:hypothetical protein